MAKTNQIPRWCLIVFGCLFSFTDSWSHPHGAPVKGNSMIDPDSHISRNKGGYGYIASSEAEAVANMSFSCTQRDQNKYYECYAHGIRLPEDWFSTYTPQYLQPIVLQRLREHLVEKMIYEHAALSTTRGNWPASLPSCMAPSSGNDGGKSTSAAQAGKLLAIHASLPTKRYDAEQMLALGKAVEDAKKTGEELRINRAIRDLDRGNKFNSTVNSLSSGNVVRTLILHDQLESTKKYYCASSTEPDRNKCTDLTNQVSRLKDSYPMLFQGSTADVDTRLNGLRNNMYDLMGAKAPYASAELRRNAGKALYNGHAVFNVNKDSFAYRSFEADVSQAIKEGREAYDLPDTYRDQQDERQAQAFNTLNQGIGTLMSNYRNEFDPTGLNNVCGLTLNDFFTKYPNVVRQAMADARGDEQALMKLVYCQSGNSQSLAMKPQCAGVTSTNTGTATEVTVDRTTSMYPFGTKTKAKIITPNSPANAIPTLQMSLNMPSTIRPRDKYAEYVAQIQKNVNDFYNCSANTLKDSSGAPKNTYGPVTTGFFDFGHGLTPDPSLLETVQRKCPPNPGMPKINFEITLVPKYICIPGDSTNCVNKDLVPEPKMVMHECYNGELKNNQTNCTKIKEHSVTQCKARMQQMVQTGRSSDDGKTSELDDYLTSAVSPLSPQTHSDPLTTSHCSDRKVTTPAKKVSDCTSLTDACKKEICMAQALCRFPEFKVGGQACWNDDTIARYCDGRLRSDGQAHPEKQAGHPDYNREDSGNLTPSTTLTTFVHEIGHAMGTEDEYQDSRYPFLPQGEHDSIWNAAGGDDGRIYPRHFNKFLEPRNCP